MQVITLNDKALTSLSVQLAQKVLTSSWEPELIIGIRTGGIYVAQPLYEEISQHYESQYNTVSLSRISTQRKKKINISKILKKLPYFLLDFLRNLEVLLFEKTKTKQYVPNREKEINITPELEEQISSSSKILLVDDAVDTGTTLLAIKNKLLSINPDMTVKTAVLTITHKTSFIDTDFYIYNRVLLRCPWSEDYKEDA